MTSFASRLVVMVKEPAAGRVKTRLARGIGVVAATQFYRRTTAAVLARVTRPGEWQTILAVAPDAARASRAWPGELERIPQGRGDLGQRMQRVMDTLPPGPVLIIGSDILGIRAEHIRAAFRALGSHDAVFGPAPDGGYWLVGLKRFPRVPRAFGGVRWSSEHALADTARNLRGLRVARVAELDDVDEVGDWARGGGASGRRCSRPQIADRAMRLPDAGKAIVDDRKITEYLLSQSHPRGSAKAEFFRRFGFRHDRPAKFRDALMAHALSGSVIGRDSTRFGEVFEVNGRLNSPDGRNPWVRVVWFVRKGETAPRLVTAIPSEEPA